MTKQDLTAALIKYGLMADIRDKNRVNHFGGVVPIIKDNLISEARILKVIYSQSTTIVFWDDNTKTIAKKAEEDFYNSEVGLLICILKKILGTAEVSNILNDWFVPNEYITYGNKPVIRKLSDIREDRKEHKTV